MVFPDCKAVVNKTAVVAEGVKLPNYVGSLMDGNIKICNSRRWAHSHRNSNQLSDINVPKFHSVVTHYNFDCCNQGFGIVVRKFGLGFCIQEEGGQAGDAIFSINISIHRNGITGKQGVHPSHSTFVQLPFQFEGVFEVCVLGFDDWL